METRTEQGKGEPGKTAEGSIGRIRAQTKEGVCLETERKRRKSETGKEGRQDEQRQC